MSKNDGELRIVEQFRSEDSEFERHLDKYNPGAYGRRKDRHGTSRI